jgi:thiol:disulfide interchange protein DsbA
MKLNGCAGKWLLALALAAAAAPGAAQPQAGRDFSRLDPPRPVSTGSRIEVIEFFYYGCPVCYETEPMLSRWLTGAPDDVAMRRIPAVSSESWAPFARLFYTLDALGQIDRLHWPIYDSFQLDDVRLNDEKIMPDWAARNGVDRQRFVETYRSPEVAARVEHARELIRAYDVSGVPTFVVDGKFVTSARLAGGTRQVIEVLDSLVKLAREQRAR